MKLNLKLRLHSKILISIITTTVLIFGTAIGIISYKSKNAAFKDATKLADAHAREYANLIRSELNTDLGIVRALAEGFQSYKKFPKKERNEIYLSMIRNCLRQHSRYVSVWLHWELKALNPNYNRPSGRVKNTFYRKNGNIASYTDTVDIQNFNSEGVYYLIRENKEEVIIEPYAYSYTRRKSDEIFETTIAVPILDEGWFAGLVGIDLALEEFQDISNRKQTWDDSFAFFLSNKGIFIAHPEEKHINKSFSKTFPKENIRHNITENIQEGRNFSYIQDYPEGKRYITYAPVTLGETKTPWSIGFSVPLEVIMENANHNFLLSILTGVFGILLLGFIVWLISRNITRPLNKTTKILQLLDKGMIDKAQKLPITTNDELGEVACSLNRLIDGMLQTADFATVVGHGKLNTEYKLLSDDDVLGNALLEMRECLRTARDEEEKRKAEDKKQNWINQGIAKFSDLSRQNQNNIQDFSFSLISNLVRYIEANQGGIFVINDNNPDDIFLETAATFAYNKKKYNETRIEIGENLIGRSVQERETIYMTELPSNYINITSGLGTENPQCLLIIPMVFNNDVYGVIELASFKELQKYEIEFVRKISESIASTLSNLKISIRTTHLLQETREQSEELISQEEEMRQNLEELQATQEGASRREAEIVNLMNAINSAAIVMEFNLGGTIININDTALNKLNVSKEFMLGKSFYEFAVDAKEKSSEYELFWQEVKKGRTKKRNFHAKINGTEIWVHETFTPIYNSENEICKILNISNDYTEEVLATQKLIKKNKKLKKKLKNLNLTDNSASS